MLKSKAQRELETIVNKIATLEVRAGDNQDAHEQLQKLQAQVDELRTQIRSHQQSGAWARTELARQSDRPYTLDYVERIFTDWTELHGDRNFGDDPAMICGIARFNGQEVMVIGHQKGRDIKSRRSEEHTSELQSRRDLVCRLLLEKKKKTKTNPALLQQQKNINNR